jgi:hypothetical protein
MVSSQRGRLAGAAPVAVPQPAQLVALLVHPGLEVGDLVLDEPGHIRVEAPRPRRQEMAVKNVAGFGLVRLQHRPGLGGHLRRVDGR